MTRRDYCSQCSEMVSDYDPMCQSCNESVCESCLQDGRLKEILILINEYGCKLSDRNNFMDKEQQRLGLRSNDRTIFEKYQYSSKYWTKKDEEYRNELDDEYYDIIDTYICEECIEKTEKNDEISKLKTENAKLKSENIELKRQLDYC